MLKLSIGSAVFAVMLGLAASQPALAIPLGYALGNGGTTLHVFDVNAPGAASAIPITNMGVTASLDALDFRPADGALYGYDDVNDTYYTVDTATGALTLASGDMVTPTGSDKLDIDFNPTIDRLRTVTELDENIVYNPNTGTASDAATTPLFYVGGDPNFGANPLIAANGYTNSFASAATTTQYVLDSNLDALAILGNNTGELTTVAPVTLGGDPLDFSADAGLDIFFGGLGANTAYALLNVNSTSGLYTIDLTSGAAASLGSLPVEFGTATGLAVAPVPEPSTMTLTALGALGLAIGAWRRRRSG